jgi:hypothetical protein|eukprot:COSAG01_NODE_18304_length_1085_cov_39.781947_2_plen_97_part_00
MSSTLHRPPASEELVQVRAVRALREPLDDHAKSKTYMSAAYEYSLSLSRCVCWGGGLTTQRSVEEARAVQGYSSALRAMATEVWLLSVRVCDYMDR